ncbi:MAG TPA: hypothetical protein VMI75_32670 [Polyangiaceae bacterium]|nr:hypothetical protein [Polyangiaceae bacterium]
MRLAPAAMAVVLLGCHAARSPTGLTPCREGTVPLLGACVDPAVGDAWCGPAARMSAAGACVFRECAADEALDLDGSCVPLGLVVRTGPSCPAGAALVVASHHTACIPSADACPRGRRLEGSMCKSPPAAAPPAPGAVDLGAWAARVLGPSGGPGAAETCRPLAQRPDLFGLTPGQAITVRLSLWITAPDEDLSRVYAEVRTQPLPAQAQALVRAAVDTSIEALRGSALAGEGPRQTDEIPRPRHSSGTAVALEVSCAVKSL